MNEDNNCKHDFYVRENSDILLSNDEDGYYCQKFTIEEFKEFIKMCDDTLQLAIKNKAFVYDERSEE